MQNHMQPMFYGFQRFSMLQPDSIRGLSKEVVEEVKDRSVLLREACQRCVIAHAAQCLLSILCWWLWAQAKLVKLQRNGCNQRCLL